AVLAKVKVLAFTKNLGFGRAVNTAITFALEENPAIAPFLIANNDPEFPVPGWSAERLKEIEDPYVLTPTTGVPAVPATRADGIANYAPTYIRQASAFCWLVPKSVIERIRARYGFPLFDSEFFAYGEDDLTAAILRKQYGPKPFKVVHRSWVKHLK